jgi:hypothetical protein
MEERDAGVPVLTGMPIKEGWRVEMVRVRGRSEDVFISPDGTRYIRATALERPDLVVELNKPGLGPMRLRNEQRSMLTRAARREARAVRRGNRKR